MLELGSFSSMAMPSDSGGHDFGAEQRPASAAATVYTAAGRYGEGDASRLPGIALTVGLHLLIVPALLGLGYQAVKTRETMLTAVNLSQPAPPPQPHSPEPAKAEPLQTQVQRPQVVLPAPIPQPTVAMVPVAVPQVQPTAVPAPPVPALSPAPAVPAPPSTVTSDALGTRMISGNPPRYPVESRRKKEQGTVRLRLVLGTDGRVEAISVAQSSGFARLDDAALGAVRRWRWAPTLRNGSPVKVSGVVEIPFVLTSG